MEHRRASPNVYSIAAAAECCLESVEGPVSDAPLSLHKQRKTKMNHRGRRRKGGNVFPLKERRWMIKHSGGGGRDRDKDNRGGNGKGRQRDVMLMVYRDLSTSEANASSVRCTSGQRAMPARPESDTKDERI